MGRSLFFIILLTLLSGTAGAATHYVPDNFPTIQNAIDAAAPGDTIIVRPGTYGENVDFRGKAITLKSEKGPDVTTIDGQQAGSVAVFVTGEGLASVLNGFTLTNGTGSPGTYGTWGGAIYCDGTSPTISGNTITGNRAERGGGIYCDLYASPAITDNIFSGNNADLGMGGGLCCFYGSSPAVTGNRFTGNSAYFEGGGLYFSWTTSTISNNLIEGNATQGTGGGIYFTQNSMPVISDNRIVGNTAIFTAGGIYCEGSDPMITRNVFTGNAAGDDGGGICCYTTDGTITNNIVAANSATRGAGIFLYLSRPIIAHNTIVSNQGTTGGGIYVYLKSSPLMAGTILRNNTATTGPEIWVGNQTYPSSLAVDYCNVKGGQLLARVEPGSTLNWGTGNIDAAPLFANAAQKDYHLTWNSSCRNSGGTTHIFVNRDFEGDPRVVGGILDIGADEFHPHLYSAGKPFPGASIAIRVVGYPGFPVQLGLGRAVQDPPQTTPYGDLRITLPPLLKAQLGTIPGTGILERTRRVPSAWLPGSEHPFQALVGPVGGSNTQLTNLLLLTVE